LEVVAAGLLDWRLDVAQLTANISAWTRRLLGPAQRIAGQLDTCTGEAIGLIDNQRRPPRAAPCVEGSLARRSFRFARDAEVLLEAADDRPVPEQSVMSEA